MADNRTYEDKPLWDLMEEAADTLESASERYYVDPLNKPCEKFDEIDWRPANLRYVAQQWREEADAEDLVRKALLITLQVNLPMTGRRDRRCEGVVDKIMDNFTVTPKFPIVTTVSADHGFPVGG